MPEFGYLVSIFSKTNVKFEISTFEISTREIPLRLES